MPSANRAMSNHQRCDCQLRWGPLVAVGIGAGCGVPASGLVVVGVDIAQHDSTTRLCMCAGTRHLVSDPAVLRPRLSGHAQADYPCAMNALAETRKHFPWRTAASALGGVLLLGALLLWVTRAPLAAWAIEYVMNDQGLCPCEVNVISLGLSHSALSLQRSALGSIARIDIDYRLSKGVDKALDLLRIEGARLSLAWHDGKLSPDIAARGGTSLSH